MSSDFVAAPSYRTSFRLRNQITGVAWPPVPNPWAAGVIGMLYQMDQTQWWPIEDMRARQLAQSSIVLKHAYSTTAFYRGLYDRAGVDVDAIGTWNDWRQLPIVTRSDLQSADTTWHSNAVPQDHGELMQHFTSGSTGRPLRSLSTTLTHLLKIALVMRNHQWAGRDTQQKIAFIQEAGDAPPRQGKRTNYWQKSLAPVIDSGPALTISVRLSVAEQVALLMDFAPTYLITYPSVLAALARYCIEHQRALPELEQVGTYGEILEPSCRELIREAWNVAVIDGYSAKEMGPIALQCPRHEHYHVQSDAVIVEILDEQGQACVPGEVGRVVLTSLHNFAAPMIRYDIGDFAEQGSLCDCGRTLPVMKRILGRQRNMLKYPDGSQRWPSLSAKGLAAASAAGLPPVQQFQLVQHSLERLEGRIVVPVAFSEAEEDVVRAYLRSQLGAHWEIAFSYLSEIPRTTRGKFEDFVSLC